MAIMDEIPDTTPQETEPADAESVRLLLGVWLLSIVFIALGFFVDQKWFIIGCLTLVVAVAGTFRMRSGFTK
jgi:hypothetical protein